MRQQPWPSDSQVTRSANEIHGTSRTSTVRNTTRSCSTLLWFRLCSSACGTASGDAVRRILEQALEEAHQRYRALLQALEQDLAPAPPRRHGDEHAGTDHQREP